MLEIITKVGKVKYRWFTIILEWNKGEKNKYGHLENSVKYEITEDDKGFYYGEEHEGFFGDIEDLKGYIEELVDNMISKPLDIFDPEEDMDSIEYMLDLQQKLPQ